MRTIHVFQYARPPPAERKAEPITTVSQQHADLPKNKSINSKGNCSMYNNIDMCLKVGTLAWAFENKEEINYDR